jgi:hypothetical protein
MIRLARDHLRGIFRLFRVALPVQLAVARSGPRGPTESSIVPCNLIPGPFAIGEVVLSREWMVI